MKPIIAVTMGDPAGIGPEVALAAFADNKVNNVCTPVIVGEDETIARAAKLLGLTAPKKLSDKDYSSPGYIHAVEDKLPCAPREQGSASCGTISYQLISRAIKDTYDGAFNAMVTGPICKESFNAAGVPFPGHTEMLESFTGQPRDTAVMMLYSPVMTVTLVTTHVALKDVPRLLSVERIAHVIRLTHGAVSRINGGKARLAVLGLNCHAGEGGMFGDEEIRLIKPAIEIARSEGIDAEGPISPDTAFTHSARSRFDAHVCMYHDQGLTPFKTVCFETGVNVTLGIPIIRTSVDHGTAFDIAWRGKADPSSMVSAILLAAKMCGARKRN